VEESVRRLSQETLTTVLSGVAALAGILAVGVSVWQLRLALEEAKRRPRLEVTPPGRKLRPLPVESWAKRRFPYLPDAYLRRSWAAFSSSVVRHAHCPVLVVRE
jgi:hypothetical protein